MDLCEEEVESWSSGELCVIQETSPAKTPSSIADYGAGSTPINKPSEAAVTSRIRAARDTIRNEGEVVIIHLCAEET